MSATHTNILAKKKSIDEIYYAINGYVQEDEQGEEIHTEGLKDELEKSYTDLEEKAAKIDESYQQALEGVTQKHNEVLKEWGSQYDTFVSKIHTARQKFNRFSKLDHQ